MPRISRRAALALPGFAAASAALAAPPSDAALIELCRHWIATNQAEHAILSQYYETLNDKPTLEEQDRLDALHWQKVELRGRIGATVALTFEGYRAKAAVLMHILGKRPGAEAIPEDDDYLEWSLARDLTSSPAPGLSWPTPPD